jgi:hypothetical protein
MLQPPDIHLAGGRGRVEVTDDHLKIYVDATRPATLNDGAGNQTDFATLARCLHGARRPLVGLPRALGRATHFAAAARLRKSTPDIAAR